MIPYLIATLALGLSTIPQTIWALSKILPKRHSVHWITGLAAFKLGIYSFLVDYLLRNTYGDTNWWYILWLLLGTSIPSGMYMVFIYVFDGQMIKRILVPLIVETVIGILAMLGLSLANMFAVGKLEANLMTDFGAWILLVPLFGYGLFTLFWKITGCRILKFREYEFKHTRILWVVALLYLLASVASYWQDVMASEEQFLLVGLIPNILLGTGLVVLLLRNRTRSKQEMLHQIKMNAICKVLDAEYSEALTQQEDRISQNRAYIEQHLQEMQSDGEASKTYYQELLKTYQEIDAGIFSEHKLIDAVLSRENRYCRAKGIETAFSVRALSLDKEKEKVLLELFLYLFEVVEEEMQKKKDGKMQLLAAQVVGRIRINFRYESSDGAIKTVNKETMKKLRQLVKGESGELEKKQYRNGLEIELFI